LYEKGITKMEENHHEENHPDRPGLVLALGLSIQALAEGEITVVSREEGSGTRGAFIELFKVEVKDADGKKRSIRPPEDAEISNSTQVVMTSVASNPAAIGYVSLGSLNDTVKAVAIDARHAFRGGG
jgi:phosphate transport system substrate-binding protein